MRRARTTVRYLGRTLPHIARVVDEDDVVHVQGMFALTPELITVAKARRATVVCSPHNTFVRETNAERHASSPTSCGAPTGSSCIRTRDVEKLAGRVPQLGRVPLVQFTPPSTRSCAMLAAGLPTTARAWP